jgi:hypothetical protein
LPPPISVGLWLARRGREGAAALAKTSLITLSLTRQNGFTHGRVCTGKGHMFFMESERVWTG